jgi:hypothetical protein
MSLMEIAGILGSIIVTAALFYKYRYESVPIIDMNIPAPVNMRFREGIHQFEIPVHYKNSGSSSAHSIETYHLFFTYPPGTEDKRLTEVPDMTRGSETTFTITKYLPTNLFLASTNAFQFQNMIMVNMWKSDNPVHAGKTYFEAQWYRLSMSAPSFNGACALVKSKKYQRWFGKKERLLNSALQDFFKGETIDHAYDTERLKFERGDRKQ